MTLKPKIIITTYYCVTCNTYSA